MSILIRNGRVITAADDFFADVWIEGERIAALGADLGHLAAEADRVLDATGKLVIPGGVDAHTHLDMPWRDIATADDFESGTIAAAFGGTTTIIDFATQERGGSTLAALDAWHARADGRATVDYGFHMVLADLPPERLPEIPRLVEEGVTSFKMFMAYPGVLYADDATHYRAYRAAAEVGARISLHAENGIVIDEIAREALAAGRTGPEWHGRTRPARLAGEAVHRAASIAEVAGASLYIVHLDCEEALVEVKRARERGVDIHAETCPQYLFLDESLYDLPDFADASRYVMSPPLRDRRHQDALWRALAAGELQVVATDHAPFTLAQKARGRDRFTDIPNGAPGIEHRLSLVFHGGVVQGRLGRGSEALRRWVAVCSTEPARLFGLYPRKGTLAVGSDADVVIFDPDRETTISAADPDTHHMRVDYDAYEGMTIRGWPEVTISRGRVLVEGGRLRTSGGGRYLRRARVGELLR